MVPLDHVQPQHRNGIAGHHQLFDVPFVQPVGHLSYKTGDFFPGPVAIRGPGRIPDEDEIFVGQLGLEPFQDGEPAYAGIDYANGLLCLHHDTLPPELKQKKA